MIECPYTKDISHSYLADLLLVDSPRRSRILIWLFARYGFYNSLNILS